MEKLLVIETDGINDIAKECADFGWQPIFVQTKSYHSWLPLEEVEGTMDVRTCGNLSYFDIIRLMMSEDVRGILPISLLEPEGVRDSLVKDHIQTRNIPVNIVANSSATMECTFDKWLTKEILAHHHIPVTPGRAIETMEGVGELLQEFGFPLIIKERKSYTGMGVRIVHNANELQRHVTRNFEKGLFAEPFLPGSEVSMEVIAWKGDMYFQPMVYKGETRQNIVEHPAYRPRISPYKAGTLLEEKIISIVGDAVEKLQLQGAAEFEFIITDGEPYVMEINPRISGITRLCKAAGGMNVYRQLTHAAMTGSLGERRGNGVRKYALQLPLTVLPEGELLERLRRDPHISYIKPITWMPLLPIKSNIIMSYDSVEELYTGMMEYAAYTHNDYLDEARKAFEQF